MNAPFITLRHPQAVATGQARGITTQAEIDVGWPEPIGRKSRRLFRDLRIYKTPQDTGLRLLYMPMLRQVALVAIALYCLGRTGGTVRRQFGRSYLQQARDIASLAWREGLSANAYYMLEFYRPDGLRKASQSLAWTNFSLNSTLPSTGLRLRQSIFAVRLTHRSEPTALR